jgi:hypothetical protein
MIAARTANNMIFLLQKNRLTTSKINVIKSRMAHSFPIKIFILKRHLKYFQQFKPGSRFINFTWLHLGGIIARDY